MDKYIGQKLDMRYEISELIGIGGMANVYKAFDSLEGRVVAVKILRDEFNSNEEFLRRFKNESKAIAMLSHPNIVKVYDVSLNSEIYYIVMELIDGITLKEYIEQQQAVRWKEAVHFTVQILRALQHAHDRGIIHRDIKPHNIMLLSDGTIKVTDFGIARFARSDSHTITDRAIGSVHYISPEQASGENVDEKSDLYSVGVMLFEMLTGKLPFEADTPVSVAIKQIQSEPEMPRSINQDIPVGLEEITMKAMQKDPEKRYQSAAEMLHDLDEFRQNPSIVFGYQYPDEKTDKKKKVKNEKAVTREQPKYDESDLEEEEEEHRKLPFIPILTGVAAAFVLVTLIFMGSMIAIKKPFERVPEVELPNFVGKNYQEVMNQYGDQFEIQIQDPQFNDEFEKDRVFDQLPKAGKTVKEGSIVKLKVSSGVKTISLSEYANQELENVLAKLKNLGFKTETVEVFDDNIPQGYVVKTEPGKGVSVSAGSVIMVYSSLGKEKKMVKVPKIINISLEDAENILKESHLLIGEITTVETSDYPEKTVLSQNPSEDTVVVEGSRINVQVTVPREKTVVTLPVQLPENIDSIVTVQASLDEVVKHQESLNPAEVKTWTISFEGSGVGYVKVVLDTQLYQEIVLDFNNNTYSILVDNSELFQ